MQVNNTFEAKAYTLIPLDGQPIMTGTLEEGVNELNVSDLPDGIYVIRANGVFGTLSEKIRIAN